MAKKKEKRENPADLRSPRLPGKGGHTISIKKENS
jgi:hypothetical protein